MNPSVKQFEDELNRLVERARRESEITYAEILGVLVLKQHDLCVEANEGDGEESKWNER